MRDTNFEFVELPLHTSFTNSNTCQSLSQFTLPKVRIPYKTSLPTRSHSLLFTTHNPIKLTINNSIQLHKSHHQSPSFFEKLQTTFIMDTIKNSANYVSDKVQEATSGTSKEANKRKLIPTFLFSKYQD